MAGIVPLEGIKLVFDLVHRRDQTDRDANLVIGLSTVAVPDINTTEATLTEPTGGGYARQALTDGNWSTAGNVDTYSLTIDFLATGGDFVGSVYGYFIASQSSGGTPRLLYIENDPGGPYTVAEFFKFSIAPRVVYPTP